VLREALKPTRFLQSDRQEIVALARKAVGRTTDPFKAAKQIESFVANYIKNANLSVGYASAAEVAKTRQGDCSEFAVLTAALCRAAGIPAQLVVGVAYTQDFAGREGFVGHAWTQAYVGGKWIGLDAALKRGGRDGHDAGHIALSIGNGELDDFSNMGGALSAFTIEKVQLEKRR
jgi:transglutaminase-like putative cysteine protease